MTDKQLIETLRNIKKNCGQYRNCDCCQFNGEHNECQIRELAHLLCVIPHFWDMEELERIINE